MRRQNSVTSVTPVEKPVLSSANQPVKNHFQNGVLASVTGAGCRFVVICREAEVVVLHWYYFLKGQI